MLYLAVHTSSSDLFLLDKYCTFNCNSHTLYDLKASSTSKKLGKKSSLKYGDGSSVSREQYTDTVKIGGMTAGPQTLGSTSVYSSGFSPDQFPPDGLMGMGFKEISEYQADPVSKHLSPTARLPNRCSRSR